MKILAYVLLVLISFSSPAVANCDKSLLRSLQQNIFGYFNSPFYIHKVFDTSYGKLRPAQGHVLLDILDLRQEQARFLADNFHGTYNGPGALIISARGGDREKEFAEAVLEKLFQWAREGQLSILPAKASAALKQEVGIRSAFFEDFPDYDGYSYPQKWQEIVRMAENIQINDFDQFMNLYTKVIRTIAELRGMQDGERTSGAESRRLTDELIREFERAGATRERGAR